MDFLGDTPLAALLDNPLFDLPDLPDHASLRIPPLQDPVPLHAHSRPPPLEPSAGSDREAQNSKAKLSSQKGIKNSNATAPESTNVGVTLPYDGTTANARPANQQLPKTALPLTISLRVLEKKGSDFLDADGPRKRARLNDGEKTPDFVKLPKPRARTQKDQQMIPTFGPFTILNGLVEPPPNAALLPPIEPDSHKTCIPLVAESTIAEEPIHDLAKQPMKSDDKAPIEAASSPPAPVAKKTRVRRKFCKWTTQETNDLLQGVAKFGIGNWKFILEHPDYNFNNRNPTDLKDRFRVCCPDAYNSRPDCNKPIAQTPSKPSTSAIHTSNILLPQSPSPTLETPQPPTPTDVAPPHTKSKAHALPPSALQDLGIKSFTPSARRSRRPFTADEDERLLRGIAAHGFSWSVIQKDNEQFGLGHRRSTDLRDRIRNKWPEWYAGAVPGPLASNNNATEEATDEKTSGARKESTMPSPITGRTTKRKDSGKDKGNQKHTENPNPPNQASASSTKPNTKDSHSIFNPHLSITTAPEALATSNPMPTLTTSFGLGMNMSMNMGMGMGMGIGLPAISTAIGEHSLNFLDDGGNVGPADGFDWDNTLPRLMNWDEMGV
jgi:hypothetical protein